MNETEILLHIRTAFGSMIAGAVMRETQGGLSPLLDRPGPAGRGDCDKEGCYHRLLGDVPRGGYM
jgi:hypothetical protein